MPRKCGFCGQEVNDAGEGHTLDCEVGKLRVRTSAEQPVVPPYLAPTGVHLDANEVTALVDDVKRWKADPEAMADEMLEKAMRLIPILEKMATQEHAGRNGGHVQLRAIQLLTETVEKVVTMVASMKAKTAP